MNRYIVKALKYYASFAVLNILYKILKAYALHLRVKKLWKHLPGDDSDPLGQKFRAYAETYNFNDFYYDSVKDHYSSDIIKLPSPQPSLLFNSEKAVKWLLKDEFQNVTKPGDNVFLGALSRTFLGPEGIFTLQHGNSHPDSHSVWQKQRKTSSLVFTKSNFMKGFYSTFVEKSTKFVGVLKTNAGQQVDIQDLFFSFTMDSIEKFFMGVEVNTVEGEMSEYAKQFDMAHKSSMMQVLAENFGAFMLSSSILPFPFGTLKANGEAYDTIFVKLALLRSASFKKFQQSISALEAHIYRYVRETRSASNLSDRKDIIANFLNSSMGAKITDSRLRDIVLNLTIAGRDTTACCLSWMFFELTQNLDVQKKLIEEVDRVLGKKIPTLEDLDKGNMPYLNGVIYEALRMHPPVPNDPKMVAKETKFPDGTVIPAGTLCFYDPSSIGRNPKLYPNPEKFDPERWIPFEEPSLYQFPVFQAGPRFCLGKDFAHFEMRLLSTIILQNFHFTMKKEDALKCRSAFMLTNSIAIDDKRSISRLTVIPHLRK